ncbi:hypothetical protein MNBD_GAMMA23-958 [hydrothermal vent metagenome]|uniref:Inner membrane protein n=1 Tax=hydrothermal vent metagenome TaxID=652676 RepID=A0A3B0ZVK0_9ZZZZ
MFSLLRKWFDQRIIRRSAITSAQWDQAFTSLPLLNSLAADEKNRLQELTILFLYQKVFEGAQGFVITLPVKLTIALQACLPILKLGLESYAGWLSIIVYPSGFAPKRIITDENGVVHYVQSDLAGESWQRGPVILSWDETESAGVIDGSNLVIHEFAHKLDMQNGLANGFPPLHATMNTTEWVKSFSDGFDHFQLQCSLGKSIGIDCYAASAPAEFFAVLSEVFFECPHLIKQHYNEIYDLLRQYYRQDTLTRLN